MRIITISEFEFPEHFDLTLQGGGRILTPKTFAHMQRIMEILYHDQALKYVRGTIAPHPEERNRVESPGRTITVHIESDPLPEVKKEYHLIRSTDGSRTVIRSGDEKELISRAYERPGADSD